MLLLGYEFLGYDRTTDVTEFKVEGRTIRLAGLDSGGDLGVFKNAYKVNVSNKTVLDIGANIGDRALHFLNSGAEKVIAVEADPYTFHLLERNIEINELNDRIIPLNAAVSDASGIIRIPYRNVNVIGTGADQKKYPEGTVGVAVPKVSLMSMIQEYNIVASVLKMDCEGCEYDAILPTGPEALRNAFSDIAIEYHYGALRLAEYLKKNHFNVEYSPKESYYNKSSIPHRMSLGMLYASRKK